MAAAIALSAELDVSFDGAGPSLADAIVAQPDGTMTVSPDLAVACFYNDCDAETARDAIARLGPQPAATLADVPQAVAWRERPSTYVVCTDDRAVPPALQRAMAARCTSTVDWPTSHSPFLSAPERVATLMTDLARD
jgi:pimeloyl-ACP methyl ester carboxylesterase